MKSPGMMVRAKTRRTEASSGVNIRRSFPVRRDGIHQEGVSWRGPDSLPCTVGEADGEDVPGGGGNGQKRSDERSDGVAPNHQSFSAPYPVREKTASQLGQGGGALGDSLYHAQEGRAGPQGPHQEDGEEGVCHLAGGVVQE